MSTTPIVGNHTDYGENTPDSTGSFKSPPKIMELGNAGVITPASSVSSSGSSGREVTLNEWSEQERLVREQEVTPLKPISTSAIIEPESDCRFIQIGSRYPQSIESFGLDYPIPVPQAGSSSSDHRNSDGNNSNHPSGSRNMSSFQPYEHLNKRRRMAGDNSRQRPVATNSENNTSGVVGGQKIAAIIRQVKITHNSGNGSLSDRIGIQNVLSATVPSHRSVTNNDSQQFAAAGGGQSVAVTAPVPPLGLATSTFEPQVEPVTAQQVGVAGERDDAHSAANITGLPTGITDQQVPITNATGLTAANNNVTFKADTLKDSMDNFSQTATRNLNKSFDAVAEVKETQRSVFFKRNKNDLYCYGNAILLNGRWHVIAPQKYIIPPEQLSDIVFITKLPKGLEVSLLTPDCSGRFYVAVLEDTFHRLGCDTTLPIREVNSQATTTVSLRVVLLREYQMEYAMLNNAGCFKRISADNVTPTDSDPGFVRRRTNDPSLPSYFQNDDDDKTCYDFAEHQIPPIKNCNDETEESSSRSRKRRQEFDEAETTIYPIVCKRVCHQVRKFCSVIVKQNRLGKVIQTLETKVASSLVAHQTLTTYSKS